MRYLFEDLEFDETSQRLTRRGRSIHTRPQTSALLTHLLHHSFRPVSKKEIREKIWPDVAVGDSSFSTLMGELRAAVGDSGAAQRIIRTLPGSGYRFVAALRMRSGASDHLENSRSNWKREASEPFVGREQLLAIAQEKLRRAGDGRPGHLLICGELGSGKTRLIREIAGMASAAGFEPHAARVDASGDPPVLWPFVQLLRSIADQRHPSRWSALMAGDAPVVQALVRCELGALEAGPGRAVQQLRFRMAEGITRFLCRAARDTPTLLVLEDLHWADETSLLALRQLLNLPAPGPLWLVASHRPCPPGLIPDRSTEIGALLGLSEVNRLVLPPLSLSEVSTLLGAAGPIRRVEGAARRMYERSGGNPLLLWDCLHRASAQRGDRTASHRLRARIADELGRLPSAARELLCSAANRADFPLQALAEAANLPETRLHWLLSTLRALGIVVADCRHPERLRVRCEGLRRAILDYGVERSGITAP